MFESAVGRPTDLMNISKLPDPAHYGSEVRPLNYVLVQFQIYATVNSVAGSGPRTGLGPVKRPGPDSVGPDQDCKIISPVLSPGPGPLPMGSSKGPPRTGPDQS